MWVNQMVGETEEEIGELLSMINEAEHHFIETQEVDMSLFMVLLANKTRAIIASIEKEKK